MDLFARQRDVARARVEPLAVRLRPRALDEFVGQAAILGEGRPLRRLIEADRLTSVILHGPPGCGKTTLAEIIAGRTRAAFERLHAAEAGVRDVRRVIDRAHERLAASGQRTVLFLDEIHRLNRGQQDVLLADVESGVLILIGATTENPFFTVNGPLISRSSTFRFEPLTAAELEVLLRRALADEERGLGRANVTCDDDALRCIADRAGGDARRALGTLETAALSLRTDSPDVPAHITLAAASESLQRAVPYDAAGDHHYDVASALIKSMRGSDPHAALYWLARMLEGGEDPRFIARRVAICASEDVGIADPRAISLAAAAAQVTELVGLPECQYALGQAVVYIALAPKSNAIALAIGAARRDVRERPLLPVPPHLRPAGHRGATAPEPTEAYKYPHDFPAGYVDQDYLGAARTYYNPSDHGEEGRLAAAWRARRAGRCEPQGGLPSEA